MALNSDNVASQLMSDYNNFKSNPEGDFLVKLSQRLDAGFQEATLTLTNVDITTPANTLVIEKKDSPDEQITEIASKIVAYWALTIMPTGTPVAGVITTITNTATTILAPLKQAIQDVPNNLQENDNYKSFVKAIFDQVKTISWVVIEMVPVAGVPTPTTYNVTMS